MAGRLLLSRMAGAVARPAQHQASLLGQPVRQMASGPNDGAEPIKAADYRKQGGAGTGVKPYEMPPAKQDGPPPGGFGPIPIRRNVGKTPYVPSGVILAGVGLIMGYGIYKVGVGNRKRRGWAKEKLAARSNLLPLLQAEEDAKFVARQEALDAWEAQVMKDVPGWQVGESVFNTKKRWIPPYGSQPTMQ